MTPFKGTDNQSKKRYEVFYKLGIKGRITGVDAGRGIKIKVGSASYIEVPGYYCTSFKTDTAFFETGQNIGDSLIKKTQSDTFILKKTNGEMLAFKTVK